MANATITVLEADGTTETDVVVLDVGRQAAAASKSVAASTEDKAVFDAIAASLALLDNAIPSGNELQVDVVASLPAGDNNIGNVDVVTLPALPAGTNNIGDVDVLTLPALSAGTNNIGHVGGTDYETVAASQTDQMLGATGAAGDYLAGVLIIPATVSPGAVSIEDGSTNITIFAGGTDSLLTLHPFFVPLGIKSTSGGWEITTGANVSVIGVGDFT